MQQEHLLLCEYREDSEIRTQNLNIEVTKVRQKLEQEIQLRMEFEHKIN